MRSSASVVADEDAGRRVRPGERQACREPRTLDEVDALRGRPPTDPTLSSREEVIVPALGSTALPHRDEHSVAERSGVAAAKSRFGRSWPNSILSTRRYIVPTLGHRDVVEVVLHKAKVGVKGRSVLRRPFVLFGRRLIGTDQSCAFSRPRTRATDGPGSVDGQHEREERQRRRRAGDCKP